MERILFFEGKKFKNRTVMLFYYDESGMKIWFLAFLIKKKKKKKNPTLDFCSFLYYGKIKYDPRFLISTVKINQGLYIKG
jgi:hypothetical protein